MSTWQEFTAIPNGTRVFNYAFDQCVALANLYHESVIGGSFVPVPSAYMWWTDFWSYPTLINNYTPSPTPVAGAIFLARYGLYDAPNGHIGVVTQVYGDGTFDTMEQNAGTWRYVGRYRRGMANMLGFLVPKNNPAIPAGKPVAPSIPETEEAQPMGNIFVWKKEKGKQINAIFNTESGFFTRSKARTAYTTATSLRPSAS